MVLLKKANAIEAKKRLVKAMAIRNSADATRQRIAAALKRQAERIYR